MNNRDSAGSMTSETLRGPVSRIRTESQMLEHENSRLKQRISELEAELEMLKLAANREAEDVNRSVQEYQANVERQMTESAGARAKHPSEIVREVYPAAYCLTEMHSEDKIIDSDIDDSRCTEIGRGSTSLMAWQNAADKLRSNV